MPASLTRDEATTRARLVDVERYDIDVDMTGLLEGTTWRATSTVTFTCAEPGAETFVDCVAEVVSATLNGVPLPAGDVADGRVRLTGLAARNVLVVASTQDQVSAQQGIQRCVDPSDDKVYVWTSFEPDDARRAWACFDQPDLKAPHAFTVLAPAEWTVASNSAVDTVTEADGGRRWVFPDTPSLSTYVVVVNAGPFHEVRSRRGGHDLGLLCRQSVAHVLDRDAEELFGLTEAGLAFFGEQFGRPFAQEKYDHVFIPDMAGAMENWGCVTWGDFSLYRTAPTRRERAYRAEILLHEMAHMWFGDLVTMQWWDDLWLNEAFASWAATWASVHATEFTDAWSDFLTSSKVLGYASDRAATRHPIRQPAHDVAEGTSVFDAITYVKGASVLRQLVAFVGEDAFVAGLRGYFEEHAWGNTTLPDLMGAVGAASGRDLGGWTTSWLDRDGTDRVAVERTDAGVLVTVASPDDLPPRPHRLDLGVYTATDDGLRRTALVAVETDGERTLVADVPAGDLLLVNDNDLTFAVARTDPASRRVMLDRAGELPTTMARSLAVSTAWDMLFEAEIGAVDFVRCAAAALRSETEAGVAQNVLLRTRIAADQWAPDGTREALQEEVADLAGELAGNPDLRDASLRVLARTAVTDAHVTVVRAAIADDPADTELAWALLVRRAELGTVEEREVAELLARDRDPDAWIQALAVRAATPKPEAKEEVWKAVFEDRTVPSDKFATVAAAFWRPGQEDLLRDYTARYLATVADLSGGHLVVMVMIRAWFPSAVGDEEFVAGLKEVAHGESTTPIVRRNLLDRVDGLERMLRARRA